MPTNFQGLRVISFESRRAGEVSRLIQHCGGIAVSAPTMRQIPLDDPHEALRFADRLLDGQIDVVILMTGEGTRMLAKTVATRYPAQKFTAALRRVVTVARGPKPAAALREMGLAPSLTVPDPSTWQDVLKTIDADGGVAGQQVAIQEYGTTNQQLLDGLVQRQARVMAVPVYRWALPEDIGPIRVAIQQILSGDAHVALFTSATQAHHLFQVAAMEGAVERLRHAMGAVVIGSVGPIASRTISHLGFGVDYEPDAPHMAQLVRQLARRSVDLLQKKRIARKHGVDTNQWRRVDMVWSAPPQRGAERVAATSDSTFMKACRREPTAYTPIWIMRQAGRYQRAYRELRAKLTMLQLCKTPDIAAEITLMAVDRLGVDAAIIFADILLPVESMGLKLEFAKGEGPVIHNPVQTARDLSGLADADPASLDYVYEAVKITRRALRPDIALIGFAGAPFTVASYIIEGGKSNRFAKAKTMMYRDPTTWQGLMERLVTLLAGYLNGQIAAGADVVQLFDSWVGVLSPDDYRRYVLPYVKQLISQITVGTPVIHFATGNPALLTSLKEAGGDVIGLDWRCDLAEAWQQLGDDVAVMGNLDPIVLYATGDQIRRQVQVILDKAAGRPGHIFNLGHGVMPDMNPQHIAELVDAVHELSARSPADNR